MEYDVHTTGDDVKTVRIRATVEEAREALGDLPELRDEEPGRGVLAVVTRYDASYFWLDGREEAGLEVVPGEVDYGSPFRSDKGDTQEILTRWGIRERL